MQCPLASTTLALVVMACASPREVRYYQPTPLDPVGVQVLLLPADELASELRYFVQRDPRPWTRVVVDAGAQPPPTLVSTEPLPRIAADDAAALAARLGPDVAGVTLLLSRGVEPEVRARAERALDALARARTGASTHVIVTPAPVERVETPAELTRLLLHVETVTSRDLGASIAEALIAGMILDARSRSVPQLVVGPLADGTGRFVLSRVSPDGDDPAPALASAEQLGARLAELLAEGGASLRHPGGESGGADEAADADPPLVLVLVPTGTPAPQRDALLGLGSELAEGSVGTRVLIDAASGLRYDELTDPRGQLGAVASLSLLFALPPLWGER